MKKLLIFVVPWHQAHNYRIYSMFQKYAPEVEFYILKNNVRKWHDHIRPLPDNVKWVSYYEPGKYDLAILHIDQQCSLPTLGKSKMYTDLNNLIQDIPKIVINHGSPMIPEYGYDEDVCINGGTIYTQKDAEKLEIPGIKKMVGDNFMIVNSYQARDRWGWGYPIIHGLEENEWWDLPDKEPRIVTMISAGGMDKYYNRSLLSAIKSECMQRYGYMVLQITVDVKFEPSGDWDAYRRFLGESLIYINCTLDSPMPSARSEAMMSGCCVLTSKYHDADKIIENGVNGFILPDNPVAYADMAHTLIQNYKAARLIGQKGKERMIKVGNMERYFDQWREVIETVLEHKNAQEILDKTIEKRKGETYGKVKQKTNK